MRVTIDCTMTSPRYQEMCGWLKENYQYIDRISNIDQEYDMGNILSGVHFIYPKPFKVFLRIDFNDVEKAVLFRMAFS